MRGETPPRAKEALPPGALPPAPVGAGTAVGLAPTAGDGNPPGPTRKEPENVVTIWGKRSMGERTGVRTTYQVVGYLDIGDRPHVERLGVMELPGEDGGDCARFLANQLLTWRFARPDPPCAEPVGYSAELTRGRRYAATGLWVPDAGGFVDVAYLDPDCGGVEWELGTHTAAVTRLPVPDSAGSGPRLLR